MTLNRLSTILAATAVTTLVGLFGAVKPALAATVQLIGLTDSNSLVLFNPDDPTKTRNVAVTGVNGNLLGIDIRPANGLLYGITDTNDIYTIDFGTGEATLVSSLSPIEFEGGNQSGFDFNPVPDRLRLVGSNDQNLRINVDTGAIADLDMNPATGFQPDGTLAYGATDVNAGANPNITAAAYTNSFAPSPDPTRTTQLFGIDSALDVLVLQSPPNAGTLTTIGSLGIDFDVVGGFDILADGMGNNVAYAASNSTLYNINLSNGSASTVGTIGDEPVQLVGLAATTVPEPATGAASLLGLGGLFLVRRFRKA
ncbi:DUF4394 domain-containing protein [Leptolyngbya sp. FACHB-671]|uniref:DUF4394 domain-containing protein n=1 Tax=Leptolyngbya sp. FACHB-671 TaxID=2692812 RepID=UPI001688C584|nr:DUF4394 domain-containing protein [Leptolyngbya sp. FACHB-671]MBD2069069.1 DUF4394 domain-containing protein [Leptolyngbya sp. FACHB-671]